MDTLRWILLLLGVMILAGIYLFGRMRAPRHLRRRREEEALENEDLDQVHIRAEDPYADAPRLDPDRDEVVTEPGGAFGGDLEQLQALVNEEAKEIPTVRRITPRPEEDSPRTGPGSPKGGRGLQPGALVRRWLSPLFGNRARRRGGAPSGRPAAAGTTGEMAGGPDGETADAGAGPAQDEKILVLHVTAPEGEVFLGVDLEAALEELGMRFGDMDIYHLKLSDGQQEHTLFSLANMVKPGTFDPEQMQAFTTPGVSLFLRLPGPCNPVESFEAMLTCADRLAEYLGGQVLDASRSTLTPQARQHTREEVRQWALRAGLI
ncbi:MAG: cell division protein ZipA [Ectothiorhodospira sp.]